MNNPTCPRCGKASKETKPLPLSGTTRCAMVCPECYDYLTYSDDAYERFVYLERKKDESKKKEATEEIKMTNKQGRPSSWTEEEVKDLIKMRENGVTAAEMARRLGRSEGAVSGKLWQLRDRGRLSNKVDSVGTAENGPSGRKCSARCAPIPTSEADPAEEKGELNLLEQEMANTITQQREEIEKLTARIAELDAENMVHQEYDGKYKQELCTLNARVKDLDLELQDTKNALAETERQFDEYRKETENAGADAILARYEKELERTEAEISRLTRALERANRIALGVVERFALADCVT